VILAIRHWKPRHLRLLLPAVTLVARAELRAAIQAGRPIPPLYRSGVVYEREQPGLEEWTTPIDTLRRGWGDCEDLSIWRAAELQETGEDPAARVRIYRARPTTWHAVVERSGGRVEDPSRALGMGTP
jgi:hypothetical protein